MPPEDVVTGAVIPHILLNTFWHQLMMTFEKINSALGPTVFVVDATARRIFVDKATKSKVAPSEWKLLEKCLHHADKNQEVYRRATEYKNCNLDPVRNDSSDSQEGVTFYNHPKFIAKLRAEQVLHKGNDDDSASSMISDPQNLRLFDVEASQSPTQKVKAPSVRTTPTTKQTPVTKPPAETKQPTVT